MITGNSKLIVLEDFNVDWNLPKYQKPTKRHSSSKNGDLDLTGTGDDADEKMEMDQSESIQFRSANNVVFSNSMAPLVQLEPVHVPAPTAQPHSLLSKLAFWRKPLPPTTLNEMAPEPPLSVEDFFKSIKNSAQELVIVEERARGYEQALLNAKKTGQTALVEQLSNGLNAFKMETQLIAIGLTKFVAEDDIVQFYKQSKKGLRLDYVRNFARPIPGDITDKKVRADELGVFDCYVILHYDPLAKSWAETEAERLKRMHPDPILFGLMKGRRVLYVVGDWIDSLCTLNLDELAEHIGKGSVQSLVADAKTYRN